MDRTAAVYLLHAVHWRRNRVWQSIIQFLAAEYFSGIHSDRNWNAHQRKAAPLVVCNSVYFMVVILSERPIRFN